MKRTMLPLVVCTVLAATPVMANTATVGGVDLYLDGSISFGYGDLLNTHSTAGSVAFGVPITLEGVELVLGVRVDGYALGSAGILDAGPFAGVRTDVGDFWVGDVEHSAAVYLPEFSIGATPYLDTLVVPYPFGKPYTRFFDRLAPGVVNVGRYDGQFGDFMVSASYDENQMGSIFGSYDIGQVTVFAAGEFLPGASAWYLGAEASFNQVDLTGMLQTALAGTDIFYTIQGTYNFTDQLSATAAVSSGAGATFWGVSGAYQVNDLLSASIGYTDIGGAGFYGAMVTVDLN